MKDHSLFPALLFLMLMTLCTGGCSSVKQLPPGSTPVAPAGVAADPGNGQVLLSWAPVAGATSYNVYYDFVATGGPGASSRVTGIIGTSKVISGLANLTSYDFIVTAVNDSGESAGSAKISSTPSAVKRPAMHSAGNGHLTLSWDAVAGATWYNLYYSTKSGVTRASPTNVKGIATTSHTVTGLSTDSIYFFVVTAANAETESAESCEVSGTPGKR